MEIDEYKLAREFMNVFDNHSPQMDRQVNGEWLKDKFIAKSLEMAKFVLEESKKHKI